MADFIVDESKFLLNDEEEHSLFENGFTLSCGITVGDKEDESDCWELYLSEDGKLQEANHRYFYLEHRRTSRRLGCLHA